MVKVKIDDDTVVKESGISSSSCSNGIGSSNNNNSNGNSSGISNSNNSSSGSSSSMSATKAERIYAAVFYAIVSMLIIFSNKLIMSGYSFPYFDFLATVQFVATACILRILSYLKYIDIPPLTVTICYETIPIAAMFLGNVICGLGSTRNLNLPMFTALRRFSILMTMIVEYYISNNRPSKSVVISVLMMVGGSIVAAIFDLKFDLFGYVLVFLNNLFTAFNGVWLRKASVSGKCSKMGVLYYNSFFSSIIMIIYFFVDHTVVLQNQIMLANQGEVMAAVETDSKLSQIMSFNGWNSPAFCFVFILSAFMGTLLNYAIFLCTTLNSALTTAVVGCLKNVATTYVGMFFLTDYEFNMLNFVGLNISIVGSLYYTYVTLFKGQQGYGGG